MVAFIEGVDNPLEYGLEGGLVHGEREKWNLYDIRCPGWVVFGFNIEPNNATYQGMDIISLSVEEVASKHRGLCIIIQ